MIQKLTLGLHPWQCAAVVAVFFLTLIGAILVAWGFRKWNRRATHRTQKEPYQGCGEWKKK